jgi:hypothetical protein
VHWIGFPAPNLAQELFSAQCSLLENHFSVCVCYCFEGSGPIFSCGILFNSLLSRSPISTTLGNTVRTAGFTRSRFSFSCRLLRSSQKKGRTGLAFAAAGYLLPRFFSPLHDWICCSRSKRPGTDFCSARELLFGPHRQSFRSYFRYVLRFRFCECDCRGKPVLFLSCRIEKFKFF